MPLDSKGVRLLQSNALHGQRNHVTWAVRVNCCPKLVEFPCFQPLHQHINALELGPTTQRRVRWQMIKIRDAIRRRWLEFKLHYGYD